MMVVYSHSWCLFRLGLDLLQNTGYTLKEKSVVVSQKPILPGSIDIYSDY